MLLTLVNADVVGVILFVVLLLFVEIAVEVVVILVAVVLVVELVAVDLAEVEVTVVAALLEVILVVDMVVVNFETFVVFETRPETRFQDLPPGCGKLSLDDAEGRRQCVGHHIGLIRRPNTVVFFYHHAVKSTCSNSLGAVRYHLYKHVAVDCRPIPKLTINIISCQFGDGSILLQKTFIRLESIENGKTQQKQIHVH